jgi:tetratricopeptide (TPR) repeat protein
MSDSSDTSKPTPKQDLQPGAPYKKGDFIGQKYEVYGILGKGGCGVVYLVYSHETGEVYALKTFQDEFLADQEVRKRFHKEASVWVELGRHSYLVHAHFVDEISGRLYIAMEYVAPNEEGLNSLEGYLRRQPPDLAQSLRWAIQICHGMEYACSKGVRAHRDLKPANIMITQDRTAKVTDFGLAGVVTESPAMRAASRSTQPGRSGLSGQTIFGTGFGTPTHMAPEQFDNAAMCDERSDIYSFGVVLYQMAAGGRLPFPAPVGADWQAMRQLHHASPVPRLDSPLFPMIQRCLEKSPEKRYQTFNEVREDLEPLLRHQTGEAIIPSQLKELEWNNKGVSLASLGRYKEAIRCYDKALELDARDINAWNNKGASLDSLGRYEEAIPFFDRALELDPCHINAWSNKGASLESLGHYEDAIRCFDKALELDPRYANAWINKGNSLNSLGRYEDAMRCSGKALELDPHYAGAWFNKGASLERLGHHNEAITFFNQALELDPCYVSAWTYKGISLTTVGRYEDAMRCFDKALDLDPCYINAWYNKGYSLEKWGRDEEAIGCYDMTLELDPRVANAWYNKGYSLENLGRHEEAIRCYDMTLELSPLYASAWFQKGTSLSRLGRCEEEIRCYERGLEFDPRSVATWITKALAEDMLGKWQEAVRSYQQFLSLAPAQQYAKQIDIARKRLRELGDK